MAEIGGQFFGGVPITRSASFKPTNDPAKAPATPQTKIRSFGAYVSGDCARRDPSAHIEPIASPAAKQSEMEKITHTSRAKIAI